MKTVIIINEQHSLLSEQREILEKRFGRWETVEVPAEGWSLEEMKEVREEILKKFGWKFDEVSMTQPANPEGAVVFVSPVPYLLKLLSRDTLRGDHNGYAVNCGVRVSVFHNDNRKKKELPNGKIINTVAQRGWKLV